jgi:protein-S-isoprenylcysteine O-methyltransferase Ste14
MIAAIMIAAITIAWLNFVVLVISTLLTLYFYVKSVGPAALEQKIGPEAYKKCTRYRFIAGLFMGVVTINYILYVFFPLPIPLPATFPWSWGVSALIAVIIAIPAGYIWIRGMRDAGEETMVVKKEHAMYGGIYQKIRHPQAVGEMPFWWVIAFVLHSPLLVLYSFVWIPIFIAMCWAEERDLLIRYGEAYREYQKRTGFLIPRRH